MRSECEATGEGEGEGAENAPYAWLATSLRSCGLPKHLVH
jgi:hypothetical protein